MKKHLLLTIFFFTVVLVCRAQNPILWGMTGMGGTKDSGIIFNYNVATGTETNLYSFGNGTDGRYPYGSFIKASNGLLYGATNEGGAYGNNYGTGGILLSFSTSTNTETDIHDFGNDAIRPGYGRLLQAKNGLLYGLSEWGGLYDYGTLFSYNIATGKDTVLYNFNNGSIYGYEPTGSLIQINDSLLFGTTPYGGINNLGIMFSYNILSDAITDLHDFGAGNDGKYPSTLILAYNGLIYGVTTAGGTYGGSYGYGIIFSYNISTGVETILHDFSGGTTDGFNAQTSPIQATDSLIYGTTYSGGVNNDGIIYSYNISTGVETDVHDFGTGTDGIGPHGTLLEASNGLFYGMTMLGGTNNDGVIYSFNSSTDVENNIHNFGSGSDGQQPMGDLIEADTGISVLPLTSTICEGANVKLIANGATTYTWSPGAGLSATIGDTVIADPTVTTTYTITGTVNSSTATTTVTVTVIPVAPLLIQPQSPSVCPGVSVILSVPISGSGYTWNPSVTLSSSTGDSVTATPSVQTTYTVTGTDSSRCTVSGSDVISLSSVPDKPKITQSGNVLTSSATQGNQWIRNDSILQGATNQNYTVTVAGWYKVIAENPANGCSTISDSIYINPTGINQLTVESGQVTVYPNPTGGEIFGNISSSVVGVKEWSLQITDVLGRRVYTKASLNYSNAIDLSGLSNGVYFISVINKTGRIIVPVVKQN